MTSTPFIIGQVGLFLAAVSGIGIIHLTAQQAVRPPWYYYFFVWTVSMASAFLFADGFAKQPPEVLPPVAYLFRLLFGLERVAIFVFYRYRTSRLSDAIKLSSTFIIRTNTYIGITAVVGMVFFFGYGLYGAILENRLETRQLRTEVRDRAAISDTSAIRTLERKVDTLTAELLVSRQTIVDLRGELSKANGQLSQLVDVVVSMRNAIARLGVSVERQRTTVTVPSGPLKSLPTTGTIPTGKVQPPATAPAKGPIYRNGKRISANGMVEGNQYSDAGKPEE